MKHLSEEEIQKAFRYWRYSYEFKESEANLNPFLSSDIEAYSEKSAGWLRRTRQSLFLSADEVAKNLKVERSVYAKYEDRERLGTITLASLAKAAEAMDCELVYAIRPKKRVPFSQLIWSKILAASIVHPWLKKCDQRKRAEALVGIAKRTMNDPEFRRKQGWSQRANTPVKVKLGRGRI